MSKVEKKSKFGAIGSVKNFVNLVREIDFDQVRASSELPPRILVIAATTEDAERVGETLIGESGSPAIYTGTFDLHPTTATPYDAVIVAEPDSDKKTNELAVALRAIELEIPMIRFAARDPFDIAAAVAARDELVRKIPDRAPAIARHLPKFRPAAVRAIVDETARANAQFALVSNAPAAIPVIGAFAAAGADMLVLTKNQVMMIVKIAACHDRDLHDQKKILQEIAPVIGAGFLWRTVAREAASFLPLLIGTLPKVGVAYVGTMVAGYGADFYYRFGKKANKEQMRSIYRHAAESVKRLPIASRALKSDNAA